jgi:hypothetical protein
MRKGEDLDPDPEQMFQANIVGLQQDFKSFFSFLFKGNICSFSNELDHFKVPVCIKKKNTDFL